MPLRPGLLEHVLILRQRERLQRDYALHLLWLTGLQLFALPLLLPVVDLRFAAGIVCVVATLAAVQEGHYIRTGRLME